MEGVHSIILIEKSLPNILVTSFPPKIETWQFIQAFRSSRTWSNPHDDCDFIFLEKNISMQLLDRKKSIKYLIQLSKWTVQDFLLFIF